MHDPRRGFVLLVALIALAAGAKAVLYDTLDPDLFWHIRVGSELSAQNIPGPLVDDLSFASTKKPWTPYSWLADIALAKLWSSGGYRAAVAVEAVLAAALVGLIALIALEWSKRYLAAAVCAAIGGFLSLPYLSLRPVTFALVLLAVIAWLLVRNSRSIWLVVPLTALLANIHLYVVFVPVYVLCLLAADRGRRMVLLLVATTFACLCTPMLPGAAAAAWHYQFRDVMVNNRMIAEMQPFYRGQMGLISAGLVLLVLGSGAIGNLKFLARGPHPNPPPEYRERGKEGGRRLNSSQWLWILISTALLLRLGRFAPVFAIFAVPSLAVTAPLLRDRPLGRPVLHWAIAALLLLGLGRVALAFPAKSTPVSAWLNRLGPECPGYPAAAADYVAARIPPRSHHIISEFTWGGYLEWRLGGQWQILMDGRTQLFSDAFWQIVYFAPAKYRRAYFAGLGADAAILPANGSAFEGDLLKLGWKPVWSDGRAIVLCPPAKDHIVAAY